MQIETLNHAESTGDAKEKQARSCELALAENKTFVDSRFGADLFQPTKSPKTIENIKKKFTDSKKNVFKKTQEYVLKFQDSLNREKLCFPSVYYIS